MLIRIEFDVNEEDYKITRLKLDHFKGRKDIRRITEPIGAIPDYNETYENPDNVSKVNLLAGTKENDDFQNVDYEILSGGSLHINTTAFSTFGVDQTAWNAVELPLLLQSEGMYCCSCAESEEHCSTKSSGKPDPEELTFKEKSCPLQVRYN